jgi:hypothetical protein
MLNVLSKSETSDKKGDNYCERVKTQRCLFMGAVRTPTIRIRVITKLPNSEQSYKGKVKTHNYINRQNQSTTGKL